jgi:hypothetical protein
VDYKDQLIIPQTAIKQYTFRKTKDSVDQIFKHYKIIKLLFHPKLKNHLSKEEINKTKLGLKVVIDGLLTNSNNFVQEKKLKIVWHSNQTT